MVPPLRGVWASAAAESASPKPATITIFFSIMLSPTAQEYSCRRVDHSQHVKRKAVLMAVGDQYLCSPNLRGRTTIETPYVVRRFSSRLNQTLGPPMQPTEPKLKLADLLRRDGFGRISAVM